MNGRLLLGARPRRHLRAPIVVSSYAGSDAGSDSSCDAGPGAPHLLYSYIIGFLIP